MNAKRIAPSRPTDRPLDVFTPKRLVAQPTDDTQSVAPTALRSRLFAADASRVSMSGNRWKGQGRVEPTAYADRARNPRESAIRVDKFGTSAAQTAEPRTEWRR